VTEPGGLREVLGEGAPSGAWHLLRLDLREVSVVELDEARSALVIDVWTPEGGVRRMTRA